MTQHIPPSPNLHREVLLIGATGPAGIAIMSQMVAAGIPVKALVRNPERMPSETPAGVIVIQGDVLDPESMNRALKDIDIVVSVLGSTPTLKPQTLLSVGTQNLINAMNNHAARRLLCVTGMGAGDSRGHGGWIYDKLILPTVLNAVYADKDRQEEVIKNSSLDWTILRPARLTNGESKIIYREITQFSDEQMSTLSRKDLAHFIVNEIKKSKFSKKVVNLTY